MKIHSFINKLLPVNTRRRRYFELGLNGIIVILSEGLQSFWFKYKQYRNMRKQEKLAAKRRKEGILATSDEREILSYLRGIVKANEKEKQYFKSQEIRFYHTLKLASTVLTSSSIVLDIGSHPASIPTLIRKYIGCSVSCCNLGGGLIKVINPDYGDEFHFNLIERNVEKEALPYPDASFDLVLCCEVLEHLTCDPMFMLSEINRVLKQDGFLLLTTPNLVCARSIRSLLEGWPPTLTAEYVVGTTDRHNREYTVYEVSYILECAGFKVVSLDTIDVWGDTYPDIIALLENLGKTTNLRGDDVFTLAQKKSPVLDRYPSKIYQM